MNWHCTEIFRETLNEALQTSGEKTWKHCLLCTLFAEDTVCYTRCFLKTLSAIHAVCWRHCLLYRLFGEDTVCYTHCLLEQVESILSSVSCILTFQKKLYGPFLWIEFNFLKATKSSFALHVLLCTLLRNVT